MNIEHKLSVINVMKEQAWVIQSMFRQEDDKEKRKELCAQWNSLWARIHVLERMRE